jgi:hypothetical protein
MLFDTRLQYRTLLGFLLPLLPLASGKLFGTIKRTYFEASARRFALVEINTLDGSV